jgi:hypothetical protein
MDKCETDLDALRRELARIRYNSRIAARRGDYEAVARLTTDATRINQQILGADVEECEPAEN